MADNDAYKIGGVASRARGAFAFHAPVALSITTRSCCTITVPTCLIIEAMTNFQGTAAEVQYLASLSEIDGQSLFKPQNSMCSC